MVKLIHKIRQVGVCLILLYAVAVTQYFYEFWILGEMAIGLRAVFALVLLIGAMGLALVKEWGRNLTLWGAVAGLLGFICRFIFVTRRVDLWTIVFGIFWIWVIGFCQMPRIRQFFRAEKTGGS